MLSVVVVTRYLHVTCMYMVCWFEEHACCIFGNMYATYMFPGQYIDMQHAHCVLHACDMHMVYELFIHVAIFFALPYNCNIFMTRACPV